MPIRRLTVLFTTLLGLVAAILVAPAAGADDDSLYAVTVTITNEAPENGGLLTPAWVGFHRGSFDLYDRGVPISPELERLAEDGNTGPIADLFGATNNGTDATLLGPNGPIAPGESASRTFILNPALARSRYFSYASMVIPSNDAFVANGDPLAHRIFDRGRNFVAEDITIAGEMVLDAGSELNDEIPENTAAFGQTEPDTGQFENVGVAFHRGLNRPGSGGILDDPRFADADFLAPGYQVATITFEATELPDRRFATDLTGAAEVPPVDTPTTGDAAVRVDRNEGVVYRLAVRDADEVVAAHLHLGQPGENGPVVAILLDTAADPRSGRIVVSGDITDASLIGPLQGASVGDLMAEIAEGNVYVNVHSVDHPAGVVRGQLAADVS